MTEADTQQRFLSMQEHISEQLKPNGEWTPELRAEQDMLSFLLDSYQNLNDADKSIVDIAIGPFSDPPQHEAYSRMLEAFMTFRQNLGKQPHLTRQDLISILRLVK